MPTCDLLTPKLPKQTPGSYKWGQLHGAALGLAIANTSKMHAGTILAITPDILTAHKLQQELQFFAPNETVTIFPDWEILPYDSFSPHQDIISERLKILSQLPNLTRGILIAPINTCMYRLAPRDYLTTHSLVLNLYQKIDLTAFRQQLEKNGYYCVNQVMNHGEFAIRGSIIDLFPMGIAQPLRIDLFDEDIDSIRTFNPETQLSIEKIDSIELLPAHEFPLDENVIKLFTQNWQQHFRQDSTNCPIYRDICESFYVAGSEFYLPLFFTKTASIFEYLPKNSLIIRNDAMITQTKIFWDEINHRYEQLRHDIMHPILPPKEIFLTNEEIFTHFNNFTQITTYQEPLKSGAGKYNFATQQPPSLTINHQLKQPLQQLQQFINNNQNQRFLFCAETEGRLEILQNLLHSINLTPKQINSWQEFLSSKENFCIAITPLDHGLVCQDIILITENQLFGERVLQRRRRKKTDFDTEAVIRNLVELNIGDPVVHINHGIGRFLGLKTITTDNITDEYLTIEYANNDKLYVPIASLHLISRYSGTDIEHAPLHKLGGKTWEKAKRKAQKRIRDVAAELLEIYARRAAQTGHTYKKPSENYLLFAESFPFEETPDQENAIEQVIDDLISDKTMDRLICGDVGFGKTEVAMRAAFIAVNNNKQVAVLTPTTLLTQQHYQNFKDRFAAWPVNIAMLSRFISTKEQQRTIGQLKDGKIDIVIGTHKLLQKDIKFKNLGLLIIDEEHRFGVRQKEKIKSLRAHIDILALTATPIPRTLNLSFSGIRDLSIIATPPEKRLSIKTFIQESSPQIIREAIMREIMRGGQVYFLYNKVEDIQYKADKLAQLIPEAKINVAHGQMPERELEHVMTDFYHRRFNILVCTTIIESGIDVPSANTIIINRADKFGLAQLYQLRGRVGRSHHQAYAYLFIPSKKSISKDAKKRLLAIEASKELGIGFTLATHDLEIRGAGELLGEEQSGHMQAIGFNLYMEMLERAVKSLKIGEQPDLDKPFEVGIEINLQVSALIPENYIPNVHTRLILYKRITSAANEHELSELRVEMIDRFGLLPEACQNLFAIAELKLQAEPLGIQKITANADGGKIDFIEKPKIDPQRIIQLIQQHSNQYKLAGPTKLRFFIKTDTPQKRIDTIKQLLHKLTKSR
ncbi:MAG: transcription-repair coupling factor [Gammaproteobacteria bacterium]|jgi:transcription-repair coupling factor (superfamily II helicase)